MNDLNKKISGSFVELILHLYQSHYNFCSVRNNENALPLSCSHICFLQTSSLLPNMEHCFLPSSSGGKRKLTAGSVHVVHPQAAARALQEYQFLPEQPSVRSDAYERVAPSHYYDSPVDGPSARASLSTAGPFLRGNEQLATGYGLGQVSGVNLMSQQGRQGHVYSSAPGEYESVPHKNSFTSAGMDAQSGAHAMIGLENSYVSSHRRVSHDEDVSRMERKRKVS